ncbi:MAG: type II secretion system F family protein [Candidatus Aenigmarchaeota archaeon]|nr:type II secretion system F family protein [Candidatus Aenigmarchaeota archaeon]
MQTIPFLPFKREIALKLAHRFMGFGEFVSKFFPRMKYDLKESEIDFEPREWATFSLIGFFLYYFLIAAVMFLVTFRYLDILIAMGLAIGSGFGVGGMVFFIISMYPKVQINKKVREIEKNLPGALHQILVQIRAGVPLFQCITGVAKSGYGRLSEEMKKAMNEINTGKSEAAALELIARDTPSLHFRRIMWQLVNSIKSGADVGETIKEIVNDISVEQRIAIKKYGSTLNPMTMMYMMLAVIMPTLGITFLLVLSTFSGGLNMDINMILVLIMIFLVIFQFMFIGMIKSRRPAGID